LTAANNTTLTGTLRASISKDGGLHIGSTFTQPPTDGLRTEGAIYVEAGSSVFASGTDVQFDQVGFYNTTPIAQPTVTGSRGGNAALASLLTALANLGLIVDSST
jgi:hypothetical protein